MPQELKKTTKSLSNVPGWGVDMTPCFPECKANFALIQNIKALRASTGIALLFLQPRR
jgi:hypothetical protein